MKALVKCSIFLEVDVPFIDNEPDMKFYIEENGCPGTGIVGQIIRDSIEELDKTNRCWACNMQGKNEIVEIIK